ncbi:MAG: glutaredoxin 3 [Gammaproteobacteria bacterium]|nr:glutaredoxin 3 [Gammaproteobacteria bacterium]
MDEVEDQEASSEPAVVMYGTRFCPFCMRARALLQQKEVRYRDIAVDGKPDLRREMAEKSGRNTVPQIWIGATHVGGCDELMQLERNGELDAMVKGSNKETK